MSYYRNEEFYLKILPGKTHAEAYEYVGRNLAAPSFRYERENLERAWLKVFGFEYMSPTEKTAREKDARLAQLEAEEAARKSKPDKKVETPEDADAKKAFVEEFKKAHPDATPMVIGRAWASHKKNIAKE